MKRLIFITAIAFTIGCFENSPQGVVNGLIMATSQRDTKTAIQVMTKDAYEKVAPSVARGDLLRVINGIAKKKIKKTKRPDNTTEVEFNIVFCTVKEGDRWKVCVWKKAKPEKKDSL